MFLVDATPLREKMTYILRIKTKTYSKSIDPLFLEVSGHKMYAFVLKICAPEHYQIHCQSGRTILTKTIAEQAELLTCRA